MSIELLSPVGDFECLKAAVQAGADSVYFGGELFNARASANNFSKEGLRQAIHYAKLRNVKINFTLNTLLNDEEFPKAVELAKYVYRLGADAIIVQDLGLAKYLIDNFPDMDVHASTQMTAHNLQGVLALQKLGFKRVVLSRELSLHEIKYIINNSDVEIETFIHGALCISYSGQCLFSSMVGARSGNRGKCAQACRLPYELIEVSSKDGLDSSFNNEKKLHSKDNSDVLDKGYLLSPRDLCGLEFIPELIRAGVKCFKIEGRMKSPEYVATVTRVYRKYINLALSSQPYRVEEDDVKELMQVFNRGGFSSGNYDDEPNTSYVYKEKPNNMGLYIGNVSNFNSSKGLITFKTSEVLNINDTICVEHEDHKYTISELMRDGDNIKSCNIEDTVTIGRLKGKISPGDRVYKISDSIKSKEINDFINNENKKIPLSCIVTVKKGMPITMEVNSLDKEDGSYFSMSAKKTSLLLPIDSISSPITNDRITQQIKKTNNTPFDFKKIIIHLDVNTYVPKISVFNQLRRDCLEDLQNQAISRFERDLNSENTDFLNCNTSIKKSNRNKVSYSLLLNELYLDFDYNKLQNIDRLYIPVKYFMDNKYHDILKLLNTKGNLYIYLPTIVRDNYRNLIFRNMDSFINDYDIKGMVATNIAAMENIPKYKNIDVIANFSFNIFNKYTINELESLGVKRVMLSPELDKDNLQELASNSSIPTELMVYGKVPVMHTGYCFLGSSNRCYPTCSMKCRDCIKNSSDSLDGDSISDKAYSSKFFLKDRLGYNFRIIPDNLQTVTTIYNSKILSIPFGDINIDSALISVLDESIDDINHIIDVVKSGDTFSGIDYTYGNFERKV